VSNGLEEDDAVAAAVAVAPRVSLADIEKRIAHRYFITAAGLADGSATGSHVIPDGLEVVTVCMLVMRNGFVVIGLSAPASPENFNADLGRDLAYEHAVRQVWQLEGYLLREKLAG